MFGVLVLLLVVLALAGGEGGMLDFVYEAFD